MPSPALTYFLSSRADTVNVELIEISHPAFSQTYRRARNSTRDGIEVTLETGEAAAFAFYPMAITEMGDQADLDTGIRIDFGDLGEVLRREYVRVKAANATDQKPKIVYRTYRSDDLSAPLIGPLRLEATTFSFQREGASFEASAPYVNKNKTGETYNLTRFFTVRGFVK